MTVVVGIVLSLHLICMNLATAGPLICILLERREGRERSDSSESRSASGVLGRQIAGWSIVALSLGGLLGLLIGAMLWSDAYREGLARMSYKFKWGGVEYAFSLVLMIAHWAWWRRAPDAGGGTRVARGVILLLAGTNLAYHFPFLFAVFSQVQAEGAGEAITAAVFRQRMGDSLVMASAAHFLVASIAVGGASMIALATTAPLRKLGGRMALAATLIQIPGGFWLIVALPPASQRAVMGGDMLASAAFGLSMLGALALLHHLAVVALRDDPKKSARISLMLMAAVILLMTVAKSRM